MKAQNSDETKKIAKDLLQKHLEYVEDRPLVFKLFGDLGAGKTVFVKGIGEMFGIDTIVSPTFVIYNEYIIDADHNSSADRLYHFDVYRVDDPSEFDQLGLDEILKPRTIICIEWSEKLQNAEKLIDNRAHVVEVHIQLGEDENTRFIDIKENNDREKNDVNIKKLNDTL